MAVIPNVKRIEVCVKVAAMNGGGNTPISSTREFGLLVYFYLRTGR